MVWWLDWPTSDDDNWLNDDDPQGCIEESECNEKEEEEDPDFTPEPDYHNERLVYHGDAGEVRAEMDTLTENSTLTLTSQRRKYRKKNRQVKRRQMRTCGGTKSAWNSQPNFHLHLPSSCCHLPEVDECDSRVKIQNMIIGCEEQNFTTLFIESDFSCIVSFSKLLKCSNPFLFSLFCLV